MPLSGRKDKYRIYIFGSDRIGWSIDADRMNALRLFSESERFTVTKNLLSADILYCVWYDILLRKHISFFLRTLKRFRRVRIFAVVTNNIENTPEKILRLGTLVDTWVAPNKKIYDFLQEKGCEALHVPFFIENAYRKLPDTKENLVRKLGLSQQAVEGKILIGSFQRDSLANLTEAKWQKNPDLIAKIASKLPREKYILVLAGPRRHYLIAMCRQQRIPYIFAGDEQYIDALQDDLRVNTLSSETLNLLYNLIDLYLVTSESEGGPKSILEASVVEKPVFSTKVGLAPDILDPFFLYDKEDIGPLLLKIRGLEESQDAYQERVALNKIRALKAVDGQAALRRIWGAL